MSRVDGAQIASESPERVPDILVVDDTPANLHLLTGMLKKRGYRVRPVPGGKLALVAVQKEKPDLILLDINMPEMNGYEVCEHLKADEETRDIPVLFVSALDETIDKVRAFAVGGVDYVTKPFQFEEVEARVQTHLKLRRLQIEVGRRNRQLQESHDQLSALEELRDNLTHMIVHDMRSPLMAISGNLAYFMPHCATCTTMTPDERASLDDAVDAAARLAENLSSILDVSRLEVGQMPVRHALCDVRLTAHEAVKTLSSHSRQYPITIESVPEQVEVMCDASLIQRVLVNLLGNAVKFSPPESPIRIRFESQSDHLRVLVCDTGPGIPPEYHAKVFDKFGQVPSGRQNPRDSTGLGLTFCKLAVEAHGGRIGVDSTLGQSSTFWFTLPRQPASPGDLPPRGARAPIRGLRGERSRAVD